MKFFVFKNSTFEGKQNSDNTAHEILFKELKETYPDHRLEKYNCNTFFGRNDFPADVFIEVLEKDHDFEIKEKVYFSCTLSKNHFIVSRTCYFEGYEQSEDEVIKSIKSLMTKIFNRLEHAPIPYKFINKKFEKGKIKPDVYERTIDGITEKTWVEFKY